MYGARRPYPLRTPPFGPLCRCLPVKYYIAFGGIRKPLYNTPMTTQRCIIITSYLQGRIRDLVELSADDVLLCADGGYRVAQEEDIIPSLVIGDFDGSYGLSRGDIPPDIPVIVHPVKKNLSDTGLCLDYASEKGYQNILVLGGFGGREDHTVANLQYLFQFYRGGGSPMMIDEQNVAFPLVDDELYLPRREGWMLSLFSHTKRCRATVSGVLFPLEDHLLSQDYPLGLSNEILEEEAYIRAQDGALLVMLSRD